MTKRTGLLMTTCVALALAAPARAQDEGAAPPPPPEGGGQTTTQVQVVQVPPDPYAPPGQQNAPSLQDLNEHLPESSKATTDTSSSADGFDFKRGGGDAKVVRGKQGGAFILEGQNVPELHDVNRGDTLWDITGKYYGNPYNWPRVWSYNTHIQNPHWLYPGDQVRLRGGFGVKTSGDFVRQQPLVPPGTVFQRHLGYVLDGEPRPEDWGQVIGAPDDQMLLSAYDQLYIKLESDKDVEVGQLLTLWEEREVKNLAEHPLVWIRGIARVNRYNPKSHMVRAEVLESLTTIERGIRVGPADRKIDVVQPVRNKKTVKARIVGALYPHEFYGQGQVVFIDRGREHGVEVGNRFFAVSRGDRWRLGLSTAGKLSDDRAIVEDDEWARVEETPDTDEPELYPAETYAELRVLRVRKRHSTVLITASVREVPRGALVIAREGY